MYTFTYEYYEKVAIVRRSVVFGFAGWEWNTFHRLSSASHSLRKAAYIFLPKQDQNPRSYHAMKQHRYCMAWAATITKATEPDRRHELLRGFNGRRTYLTRTQTAQVQVKQNQNCKSKLDGKSQSRIEWPKRNTSAKKTSANSALKK